MTTQKNHEREENTSDHKNINADHEKGKQGFASMPKEQVKEIAAEGGRHSHDNEDANSSHNSKKREDAPSNSKNINAGHEKGKQGFASMPKEQVKEIAAEGGRHSHDNDGSRSAHNSKKE